MRELKKLEVNKNSIPCSWAYMVIPKNISIIPMIRRNQVDPKSNGVVKIDNTNKSMPPTTSAIYTLSATNSNSTDISKSVLLFNNNTYVEV